MEPQWHHWCIDIKFVDVHEAGEADDDLSHGTVGADH
jgi:hypothetical protein